MRASVLIAVGYGLGMRVFELLWSKRNAARLDDARLVEDDGMPLIAAVHGLWLAGMLVEEALLGPTIDAPWLLGIFVAAELMRFWCIATLGARWNVRVVVSAGPLVRRGPYRFLRHPNYVAVVVGLAALPLGLGLVVTPAVVVPLKLLALRKRIRVEEAALSS